MTATHVHMHVVCHSECYLTLCSAPTVCSAPTEAEGEGKGQEK